MDNRKFYPIRAARRDEWEDAMALAWRTFMKYDAPDYTKRGIDSFLEFISDNNLYKMFLMDVYHLFVAIDEDNKDEIVGIIGIRAGSHISLLFVDEHHQHMGIGRNLINYAAQYVKEEIRKEILTVNAAPYATNFYRKLGFKDAGPEEINDGISYVPMKFDIK